MLTCIASRGWGKKDYYILQHTQELKKKNELEPVLIMGY
jgi:hypothetical protein